MSITVKKASYFKVSVPNKPGQGACMLGILKDAKVNLLALTGFPRAGRAQVDFLPEDAAAFKNAARKNKIAVGEKKTAFLIRGEDKVGALFEIMEKLANAGINVTALDAVSAGTGRFGAILWVKPQDVNKTARLLGAK